MMAGSHVPAREAGSPGLRVGAGLGPGVLRLNLKILEVLAEKVRDHGATLAVVDAARYFHPNGDDLSKRLKLFCARRNLVHLPLSDALLQANVRGISTRWVHDSHFNEAGNEIFAEVMYKWLREDAQEPGIPPLPR